MGRVRGYALARVGVDLVDTGNASVFSNQSDAQAQADLVNEAGARVVVVEIREVGTEQSGGQ